MKWTLLLLAGCTLPTVPDQFTPPVIYRAWYDQVWVLCGAGERPTPAYRFDELRFHRADFPQHVLGYWMGRDIYLAADLVNWAPVVKHEMLHAQLGVAGHPPVFAQCGTLKDET